MGLQLRAARRLVIVGLSALAMYYGAYFTLLEGKVYWLVGAVPPIGQNVFEILPTYRIGGSQVERLFYPAWRFDRVARADYWTTVEKANGRKWRNP